jgi:hypothetical protein
MNLLDEILEEIKHSNTPTQPKVPTNPDNKRKFLALNPQIPRLENPSKRKKPNETKSAVPTKPKELQTAKPVQDELLFLKEMCLVFGGNPRM